MIDIVLSSSRARLSAALPCDNGILDVPFSTTSFTLVAETIEPNSMCSSVSHTDAACRRLAVAGDGSGGSSAQFRERGYLLVPPNLSPHFVGNAVDNLPACSVTA
jgi:hypothetical protein